MQRPGIGPSIISIRSCMQRPGIRPIKDAIISHFSYSLEMLFFLIFLIIDYQVACMLP